MSKKRLVKFIDSPSNSSTVVAFPGVGSSAYFCSDWAKEFKDNVNFYALEYPGHGLRGAEESLTNFEDLKRDIVETLLPYKERDLIFIGHSLGGLLAYEVAAWLQESGANSVHALFILACPAPQIFFETNQQKFGQLTDKEILSCLRLMGGVPEEILMHQSFISTYLPKIRCDFRVAQSYQWIPNSMLKCPVSVMSGDHDPFCTQDQVGLWSSLTEGQTESIVFNGNHFFVQDNLKTAFASINSSISTIFLKQKYPRALSYLFNGTRSLE